MTVAQYLKDLPEDRREAIKAIRDTIAKNIDTDLSRLGHRANSIEGLPQGAWVLMDYGDVVVHIFHQDTRGYYDLEALWYDADRVEVVDQKRA